MLSFGIEYERAFSTAFCSARLAAGSGPPSFAATMIARESFENSLPRFASAAPFLCLIEDHLLCPDTHRLLDTIQEQLVHPRIVGQLGVERGDEDATVAQQHRLAVPLRQNFDVLPGLPHSRRADEDSVERFVLAGEPQVGLEARDLAAVRVPLYRQVDKTEMLTVEHDHAGAGAKDRTVELADRLVESVEPHQAHEGRRLAPRNDESVEAGALLRLAHLHGLHTEPTQRRRVLAKVALDGQHAH